MIASDTLYVLVVLVERTPAAVAAAALKVATTKAKKDGRSNNMKWQPFMSTFVLNKMCELISSGVRTDKGFKEVHLNTVVKHVLAMIVMNHVHVCSCFHGLSGMLCAMLTVNACYDCRT